MARDHRFDFYKGMLIWGVLWGHVITALLNGDANDIGIHRIFRTYDMPFFMVISGHFFSLSTKKYNLSKLVLNKLSMIALPALVWAIILHPGKLPFGYSYFLWAVFWSSIIMGILGSLLKSRFVQIFICLLLTIGLHFVPCPPVTIYNLPYLFPFFAIGYFAWDLIDQSQKHALVFVIIFVTALCFWNTSFNIWNIGANVLDGGQVIRAIVLRFLLAISGIVSMSLVFDLVRGYLSDKYPLVCEFFVKMGQETLGLYIIQDFVIFTLLAYAVQIVERRIGANLLIGNHLLLGYVIAPFISLAIMVVLYQFIKWCRGSKYLKFLFGFRF